jgi:uncharacterized protein
MDTRTPGTIGWIDLTVPDAVSIRDFYTHVTGWAPSPVSMGSYQDFCMHAEGGAMVAGICHARGENKDIPPVWMIYITVEDLDDSIARCKEFGGKVLVPPCDMGNQGRFCVIQDPAGAAAALFEHAALAA